MRVLAHTPWRTALALAGVLVALVVLPGRAAAHAQLLSTSPEAGAVLERAPGSVEFKFGEAVEAAFGSVRVFDAEGERVDVGSPVRPDGNDSIGVKLRPGLGDGAYTATYRVLSADSHPISGGFSFSVGETKLVPKSVTELVGRASAPVEVQAVYGAARGVGYLALCLVLGVLAFWRWCLVAPAAGRKGLREAFAGRASRLVSIGVVLGLSTAIVDVVCQAATAAGGGFAEGLTISAIESLADTRSGFWILGRVVIWIAVTIVWFASWSTARQRRVQNTMAVGIVAGAMPALAGHAGATSPRGLMFILDYAHILAMSIWVGGLAAAAFALPAATKLLARADRTRLLVEVLGRFSQLALAAVGVLVATGIAQSIVHLTVVADLWESAFGRALLVKSMLLLVLIGLGAFNRFRVIPQLRRRLDEGDSPGRVGVSLRRSLSAELIVLVLVIGAASALVAYSPAGASSGPYAESALLGRVDAQLVVDPPRRGISALHIYLTEADSGRQFDDFKQLDVSARQSSAGIGPLAATMTKAGPGHYVDNAASFPQSGRWTISLVVRTSDFDQYEHEFELRIR